MPEWKLEHKILLFLPINEIRLIELSDQTARVKIDRIVNNSKFLFSILKSSRLISSIGKQDWTCVIEGREQSTSFDKVGRKGYTGRKTFRWLFKSKKTIGERKLSTALGGIIRQYLQVVSSDVRLAQ